MESEGRSSEACSAGSGDSTEDSKRRAGSTPSSASGTSGGGASSEPGSPASPSTMTFVKSQHARDPEDSETWEESATAPTLDEGGKAPRTATAVVAFTQNQREEVRDLEGKASALSAEPGSHQETLLATGFSTSGYGATEEEEAMPTLMASAAELSNQVQGVTVAPPLTEASSTSSAEGSPARTSPSPGSAAASPATDPASSSSSPESLSLFDPDGFSSRTYPVSSLATAVGTSESCLERWPSSGTAWPGGFSTHVSSECRSDAGGCSSSEPSLTEILEPPASVPERYSLSARAARGILRRAQKRGRILPPHLLAALESVAGES